MGWALLDEKWSVVEDVEVDVSFEKHGLSKLSKGLGMRNKLDKGQGERADCESCPHH